MAKFVLSKPEKNIRNIAKILVIRLSSLGDVLLTTPIVRSLKQNNPNAQIDFLVKKEFADVYKFNPWISSLLFFEKEKSDQISAIIKHNEYDVIIDLQNNFRSRALYKNSISKIYRFKKPFFKKLLLVYFKVDLLKESKTIVERYAETANIKLDTLGLEFYTDTETKLELDKNKKYIGFCPGAKHFSKQWPADYFIELGNELSKVGFSVILLGGASEKELCAKISANIPNSINRQNENDLFETAAVMEKCSLIVTNDSGLMHIASSLQKPVAAIFGSTVKSLGFTPYKVKNLILENNSLFCRPCSHIGRSTCPKKHFKCMIDVTPQYVLNHLQNFLKSI